MKQTLNIKTIYIIHDLSYANILWQVKNFCRPKKEQYVDIHKMELIDNDKPYVHRSKARTNLLVKCINRDAAPFSSQPKSENTRSLLSLPASYSNLF